MKKTNKRIGYARVSTKEQCLDTQYKKLEQYGVDAIIIDTATGKNINKNLVASLNDLRAGDELILVSIDRLGRNAKNNLAVMEDLKTRGVILISIKENLIISPNDYNPMGELMFTFLSGVAQYEKTVINHRTNEGVKVAKAKKGKSYSANSRKQTAFLKNKRFREDMRIKTRSYVMETYGIKSISTYYRYRRLILT